MITPTRRLLSRPAPTLVPAGARAALAHVFDAAYQDGAVPFHRRTTPSSLPLRFGLPQLDAAIGGELPRPGFCEIYGAPSTGKTALAIEAVAQVHAAGGSAVWIDAEKTFLMGRARLRGVDPERITVLRAFEGEDAIDAACLLMRSGRFALLVVDSIAAMMPRAEGLAAVGDEPIHAHRALIAKMVRRFSREASSALVMCINQVRAKPIDPQGEVSLAVTPAGREIARVATLRLETRALGRIRVGNAIVGEDFGVVVVRNTRASPFRRVRLSYLYEEGFDRVKDVILEGERRGLVAYGENAVRTAPFRFASRRAAYLALRADPAGLAAFTRAIAADRAPDLHDIATHDTNEEED